MNLNLSNFHQTFFALPPFEYDVKIVKKMNGKFALYIPCDSMYTRNPFTPKDAMCGTDPENTFKNMHFCSTYTNIKTVMYYLWQKI